MVCINAYEETSNNCVVEKQHSCDDIVHGSTNSPSSDVICECKANDEIGEKNLTKNMLREK